jgi:lysophospholipase L1-like esterase
MLTTRTITNAGAPLYSPSGDLLVGTSIVFWLADSSGRQTDAWDATTKERVGGDPITVVTDAQGEFSVDLWPNTRGNRSTKYKCRVQSDGFREFSGIVEDVPGELQWVDFMLSGSSMEPQDISAIAVAMTSHLNAADPHTQYAKESDLGGAASLDVGTTAGTVAAGDDARLTDARPPTGGAGGVLSGNYPNPGFAVDMATQGELDAVAAAKVDKVAGKGLSTEDYSTAEKSKLAGIAAGATVNAPDAQLRDRTTHTGAQAISTVTGLQGALEAKVDKTSLRSTRLKAALDLEQRDAYILLQGDSTGDETAEWFYLAIQRLAAAYPEHSYAYYAWNSTDKYWAGSGIHTGTNGRVVRCYNGSVSGATSVYWHGANRFVAYDGWTFDLIFVSYGLNTGVSEQASAACAALYTLMQDQPQAEIVHVIQPPDYTDAPMLERSQARSDAQRAVVAAYGVSCVDAYSIFTQLVNQQGGVDAWYLDKIHPNLAGQTKWSEVAYSQMLHTSASQQNIECSGNRVPNGNLSRWPASGTSPVWWANDGPVLRETFYRESGAVKPRCYGVLGGAGAFRLDATALIEQLQRAPNIVVAARVACSGARDDLGAVFVARDVSGARSEIKGAGNGYLGVGSLNVYTPFRWAFVVVPQSFYKGYTDFEIGIATGDENSFVVVDRVMISSGLMVPDSDGTDAAVFGVELNADAVTLAASASETLIFANALAEDGVFVDVSATALPANVGVSAICAGGDIRLTLTNRSDAGVSVPAQIYFGRLS